MQLFKLSNFIESFKVNKQIDGIIQNMIEVTNGKLWFRALRTILDSSTRFKLLFRYNWENKQRHKCFYVFQFDNWIPILRAWK